MGDKSFDKLEKYRKKRNFEVTPEPDGSEQSSSHRSRSPVKKTTSSRSKDVRPQPVPTPPTWAGGVFVIQKHDARRLHYDLRIELGGTMMSWAVPKGPSYDPNAKRLAVEVEDHPMEYNDFEGRIPDGNYGAGDVLIWDRGTYEPAPMNGVPAAIKGDPAALLAWMREKGHFHLRFSGEKLHGGWHLVRTKRREESKPQWLFFKAHDEMANPDLDVVTSRPESVVSGLRATRGPLRATSSSVAQSARELLLAIGEVSKATNGPLMGDGSLYLFEVKFDGYRLLAGKAGNDVRLFSRKTNDWTDRFTLIASAIGRLPAREVVIDGEACAVDDEGRPSFEALQRWLGGDTKSAQIAFAAFDLLWLDGRDLRKAPIEERRELLKALLAGAKPPLSFSSALEGKASELLAAAKRAGLEGLIAKRKGSVYTQGTNANWVKLKFEQRQDAVICGYLPLKGAEVVGALLVAVYDSKGGDLLYAGRVGTGFDDRTRARLAEQLDAMRVAAPKMLNVPKLPKPRFCEPRLVCEVGLGEWTSERIMRFPRFIAMREDKSPEECLREDAIGHTSPAPPPVREVREVREVKETSVKLANPSKILYPRDGITKQDVFDYYTDIAPAMLPHLQGRPIHMQRWPHGIDDEEWFQHRLPPKAPDFVRRIAFLRDKAPWYKLNEKGAIKERIVVDNLETLQWLANLAALTLHQWASHAPPEATTTTQVHNALAQADYVVIDLDPGEATRWEEIIQVAHAVRTLLDALSLTSVVKTSGKRGLHIVIPLARGPSHDDAVHFAEQVARAVAKVMPSIATVERIKDKRRGRLYVDYGQNGGGRTIVCPYTLRAADAAPVSAPLRWEEVTNALDPRAFNLRTMRARIERYGDLYAPCLAPTQTLPTVT
ncbi:DNA ligase D [Pendulispora rubella]|uniref:DNA ligase (ATP) n=1 Tax=Pendulispora rubella TaxID=2741070 RepID=A0ABZ2LH03_9BACT